MEFIMYFWGIWLGILVISTVFLLGHVNDGFKTIASHGNIRMGVKIPLITAFILFVVSIILSSVSLAGSLWRMLR